MSMMSEKGQQKTLYPHHADATVTGRHDSWIRAQAHGLRHINSCGFLLDVAAVTVI